MSQRVGHPQLDEGLTRDADASGFSIDRSQQIDGKVDVDPLDFAAGTTGLRPIDIGRHVDAGVRKPVEFLSGDDLRLILRGIVLFRPRARAGPR